MPCSLLVILLVRRFGFITGYFVILKDIKKKNCKYLNIKNKDTVSFIKKENKTDVFKELDRGINH